MATTHYAKEYVLRFAEPAHRRRVWHHQHVPPADVDRLRRNSERAQEARTALNLWGFIAMNGAFCTQYGNTGKELYKKTKEVFYSA